MTDSQYRIQIVNRKDGRVLVWAPGAKIEKDLVEDLCERAKAKGVGLLRSEARVLEVIRSSFAEMLHDLKKLV